MNINAKRSFTGVSLALAASGLIGCAASNTSSSTPSTQTDLVHCYGVNSCGGHNDCKTADNACAGQASCKGTGFVAMPSKACGDVGGQTKDDWKGEINVVELSHCYGVNVCKGHNDCKTADNACAAQATCKGTGFVAMPVKACNDIGGKVGS